MKPSIKVISFNMQFGKGWDPIEPDNAPVDLNSAIRELQKLDADVLLLQEVEEVDRRRGQIDPPPNYTRLQQAFAGYDSVFAYPAADPQELPFGYGLAIFSKTALDNFFQVELPAPPIEFSFEGRNHAATSRLLIGAQTSFDGQPLQLFNTHLQAFFIINYSSDDYPDQRLVVAEQLRQAAMPTILGGDFNAVPGEHTVECLEQTGFKSAQKMQCTWKRMPYVFDHIFYNHGLKLNKCRVVPTNASDHDIVMAELAFG